MMISTVIPVYNAERYLAEAVRSALDQEPAPDELILIDDGSSDDSARVAQSFGKRLRYVSQPNRGVGAALNHGIRLAAGDYLTFLDADDLWTPGKLKAQLELLEQHPELDMVFGLVEQFVSPELAPEARSRLRCPEGAQPGRLVGAMMIRRQSFLKVGELETNWKVGEFLSWLCRAQEQELAWEVLHRVVLRRRLHKTNTGSVHKDRRGDYARILKAALDRRRQGR